MFELAELGHTLEKEIYKKRVPELRTQLLEVQNKLAESNFPVLILISGVDGGGKGEIINLLNEWMDPRGIQTHAFDVPSEDERKRPPYWRYWMGLPATGQIGIFVGSWYSNPISQFINKKIDSADLDSQLLHVNNIERELVDDGMLIIKCWIHMSKEHQKKKLKSYKKDPGKKWRVTKKDIKHLKLYDKFSNIAERVIRQTSTGHSPWLIVDGSDIKYSSVTVGEHILDRINTYIKHSKLKPFSKEKTENNNSIKKEMSLLGSLDLSKQYSKKEYNNKLENFQGKLNLLAREARLKGISSTLVLEGWDAGGKGGAIRRITHALDARQYRVIPVAAPTDEEKAHHYLWRFWRHVPKAGQITIYDRSWYGRVLVERVEGFATKDEWLRAYTEINDFEEELSDAGVLVLKYWLHIDKEEQERRFKEREQISYKKHKITEEDYRNRKMWNQYEDAVDDMVTRTSTEYAPWNLIEANDKRFARIKVLKSYCDALEKKLG
ncbi:MAG: polyphosphate:AMP phosphotransferase [Proteobacteria bacterium]|nr:polyphosphate:AMP phosphotransferase [Pseudomonadota bacterium]NOG61671.1 polyphosphate:AMP phosphotransferase [Pseudomonadota bacterium]